MKVKMRVSFHVSAVKSRTAQQAKMKWVVNIVFYILQVTVILQSLIMFR